MLQITVNGEALPIPASVTVAEFLEAKGYQVSRIAVERNGEILPKSRYDETMLAEGDVLEIVSFVGGG